MRTIYFVLPHGDNLNLNVYKYGLGSVIGYLVKGIKETKAAKIVDNPSEADVIVAEDYFMVPTARGIASKYEKPLVSHIHIWLRPWNPEFSRFKTAVELSDHIIVISKRMKNDMISDLGNSVADRISVVYNGVDTESFVPLPLPKADYILFAGRKARWKNYELVQKEAKRYNYPLVMVGQFNPTIKPNLITWPYLPRPLLVAVFNMARLHVLPSLGEPFGLTSLEALACGTPSAFNTHTGVAELLRKHFPQLEFDTLKEGIPLPRLVSAADGISRREARAVAEKYNHKWLAKNFVKPLGVVL